MRINRPTTLRAHFGWAFVPKALVLLGFVLYFAGGALMGMIDPSPTKPPSASNEAIMKIRDNSPHSPRGLIESHRCGEEYKSADGELPVGVVVKRVTPREFVVEYTERVAVVGDAINEAVGGEEIKRIDTVYAFCYAGGRS